MCLLQTIIKNTFHLQQKVATRPIKVIKIGYFSYKNNCFVSQIYPKEYKRGEKYSLLLPKPYIGSIIDDPSYLNCENAHIEVGFHSYRDLPIIEKFKIGTWGWLTTNKDSNVLADVVAIFEIPTGAIYYSDGENHYVSDSIILRKVIFDLEEWKAENFEPEKVL